MTHWRGIIKKFSPFFFGGKILEEKFSLNNDPDFQIQIIFISINMSISLK
jgi:hypothetical protein